MVTLSADSISALLSLAGTAVFAFFGVIFYILPTLIASERNRRHTIGILLVNLFFGWTFLGWIAALLWALTNDGERQ